MGRDELSSILLKVVGFTLAVLAILSVARQVIAWILYATQNPGVHMGWFYHASAVVAAIQVGVGLFIIAKSTAITEWLLGFGRDKSGREDAGSA